MLHSWPLLAHEPHAMQSPRGAVRRAACGVRRRYPVAGRPGEFLPVATTRPETILGDTAVAVHPEDERYKQYIGMQCEVPMSGGRTVPIIGDEYVDREFGTGALKVTPGGCTPRRRGGGSLMLRRFVWDREGSALSSQRQPDVPCMHSSAKQVVWWFFLLLGCYSVVDMAPACCGARAVQAMT